MKEGIAMFTPVEVDARLIVRMAKYYVGTKKATYKVLSEKFAVGQRTISKYFNNDLKTIDIDLWEKVQEKKQANIKRGQQTIVNFMEKKCKKCKGACTC